MTPAEIMIPLKQWVEDKIDEDKLFNVNLRNYVFYIIKSRPGAKYKFQTPQQMQPFTWEIPNKVEIRETDWDKGL